MEDRDVVGVKYFHKQQFNKTTALFKVTTADYK